MAGRLGRGRPSRRAPVGEPPRADSPTDGDDLHPSRMGHFGRERPHQRRGGRVIAHAPPLPLHASKTRGRSLLSPDPRVLFQWYIRGCATGRITVGRATAFSRLSWDGSRHCVFVLPHAGNAVVSVCRQFRARRRPVRSGSPAACLMWVAVVISSLPSQACRLDRQSVRLRPGGGWSDIRAAAGFGERGAHRGLLVGSRVSRGGTRCPSTSSCDVRVP